MNEDFPKNELEFDRRFRHEQACLDYLSQLAGQRALSVRTANTAYWKTAWNVYLCHQCQGRVQLA